MKVKLNECKINSNYLTVGKEYTIQKYKDFDDSIFNIVGDDGSTLTILVGTYCSHIGCNGWKIVEDT